MNDSYTGPFLLVDRTEGASVWLEDLSDALSFGILRDYDPPKSERHFSVDIFGQFRVRVARYVIYDLTSRKVDRGVLDAMAREARLASWSARRTRPHTYRSGPVPGTGSRRWGRWLRRPQTIGERRAYLGFALEARFVREEYGVSVKERRSRSKANLPSNWDDIPRSSLEDRNWKRFRRRQWRERAHSFS